MVKSAKYEIKLLKIWFSPRLGPVFSSKLGVLLHPHLHLLSTPDLPIMYWDFWYFWLLAGFYLLPKLLTEWTMLRFPRFLK